MSDVLSMKIENFVFWILLTHSVSTGHRTFDIILLHFVRPILIFFNTLESWPICWNKLIISFAVWWGIFFSAVNAAYLISVDFFSHQTTKEIHQDCVFKSSVDLFTRLLFSDFIWSILDSACLYICDKPPVIDLLHIIHEKGLSSCGISRNHNLNCSLSRQWGLNFFLAGLYFLSMSKVAQIFFLWHAESHVWKHVMNYKKNLYCIHCKALKNAIIA